MNFLAHLLLAHDAPLARIGQLAGDFVRGPLEALDLAPDVVDGIAHHRAIDRYTDAHPVVRRSIGRIASASGLASGVAVDLAYDHHLSVQWDTYCSMDRRQFIARCYEELRGHAAELPPRLAHIAPRLAAEDWLGRYAERAAVGQAIERVSLRLSRPARLLAAIPALETAYEGIAADFREFFPQAQAFAAAWRAPRR